jgi:N-acetylneuraminic acid mutarotase
MATEPTPRSYQRTLGDMIASFTARRGITSLKVAAPTLSFLETAAQSDVRQAQDIFQALAAKSFRTAEGEALIRAGRDEGVEWPQDSRAYGLVTLGDSSFVRISDTVSSALPAPIPGTTALAVADASDFPASGSVYVGRGTDHPEGPLAYTSKTSHGSYWTLALTSPTVRFHDHYEGVVLAQGGERVAPAGNTVRTPRNDTNPVVFSTLYRAVLPDGEVELVGVPVIAQVGGAVGNVAAGALREFDSPPFSGATVTNVTAFTTGTRRQSVAEFRETVAKARASRARATRLALTGASVGISDGTSRVTSATYVRGTSTRPATVYVDDGTGYTETARGVATEELAPSALGGEKTFTLGNRPIAVAQLTSRSSGPFVLRAGSKLTFDVGGVATSHIIDVDDYRDLRSVDPYEVGAAVNADPSLGWSMRVAAGRLVVEARSGADEYVENIPEEDDANDAFDFPDSRASTLNLYLDGQLLQELGVTPTVTSKRFSTWSALSGSQTLTLAVDKTPATTYTFTNASFSDAGTGYSMVGRNSLKAWQTVFEAAIPGISVQVVGDQLVLTSNLGEDDRAKLQVTGGTLVSNGVFALGSSSGKTSDYSLDRPSGELSLTRALAAGAALTAGTDDARGVVRGEVLDQLDLGAGAKVWVRLDGTSELVETGASASNTMTLTVGSVRDWGLRDRLSAAAGTFSNVESGDLVVAWDSAFPADVRTHWYVADVASDGSWIEVDRCQMRAYRADHTATVLGDGTVLLVGGWSAPGRTGATKSTEIYDPVAETFTPTGSMVSPRVGHTAVKLSSGKVFVFGGQTQSTDSSALSTGEVWDPTTGLWTAVATSGAPTARHHHCAALGDDGKVYVYGGRDTSGTDLASGKVYDPTGGTWGAVTAMSQARSYFTFDLLSDNRIYAVGGQAAGSLLASAESYDRATDTWTNAGTIQAARQGHRSVVLDSGKLFVVGGSTALSTTTQIPSLLTDLYTVAVGWAAGTSMNRSRVYHGLAKISGGKVVAGFGQMGTGSTYAEVYDPAGPSWTNTAAPKGVLVRSHCTASTVASGYVVFCGGRGTDSIQMPNASAEKYRVSNDTWSQPEVALSSSIVLTTSGMEVSRGETRPVVLTAAVANDYTADALVDEFSPDASGRGGTVQTWRTSSVQLRTTSASEDSGQLFVAAADGGGRSIGFEGGDVSTTSAGHPAASSSRSDTAVPNFRVSNVVRSGSAGSTSLAPGNTTSSTVPSYRQQLVGLRTGPDSLTAERHGQNRDFVTWPTTISWDGLTSGLVDVGVRTAPDLRWVPGDRVYWSTPYLFGASDELVAVLSDPTRGERRYTSRTYRPAVPTGSYSSTITLRDASGSATSLAAAFGTTYDFRDHRVLMKPRVLSHPADASKRVLWRWWRYGEERNVYVRYGLPDAPDAAQTTVVEDVASSTTVTVKLAGGAAKTGATVRGSTRIGVAAPTVTSGIATAVYVLALVVSSATRAANVTTLTLTLPSGVTDHGIAANDLVYLDTTHPNYGCGTFKVTTRTATTISFADAAADSGPDASIGTISRDFAKATLGAMAVAPAAGDFFRVGGTSSLDSNFVDSTIRLTGATNEHLTGKLLNFQTTSTTTLVWGYLRDVSVFKIFANPARTATQVVAALTGSSVTAVVTGTGSGQIDRSTAEELGAYDSAYQLVDGENWISSQVDPATVNDDYQFTLKEQVSSGLTSNSDWTNEAVRICPSSAPDVARWLRLLAVSGLSSAAEVSATTHRKVQVASSVQGAQSTLQLSGTANASAASLVGSAEDAGDTMIVTVPRVLADGLPGGSVVLLANTSGSVKSVFTSTTTLVSVTALGKFTFGVNAVWASAASSKANVVVSFERHGDYVCLQDTGLGTALDLTGLAEGDWVVVRTPAAPTSAPDASDANIGTWRVVKVDATAVGGGALWIENPAAVEQTMAEVDLVFPTRNSIMPGDVISVSAPVFGTTNYGRWVVTAVGDAGGGIWTNGFTVTVDVTTKTPTATTPGTALGADSSLVQVTDSVPYRSVRTVVSAVPHPTDATLARLRLSPDTGYEWIGAAAGTVVTALDKLGFSDVVTTGSDAYRYWTGLVGATNRVLQGDPTDPASYPGYEAANASVEVRGALHRRIKIALQVRLNGGDRQSTLAKIRSAVASAIMSYPHGKPIPISEAISAATLVEGVESVVPITTYDSTHDLIPVPADEKVIVYPDEDVSVTVGS